MLREIHEQPEVWQEVCGDAEDIAALARRVESHEPSTILTVGRGSSGHAGLYARYATELLLGLPTGEVLPSVHTGWRRRIRVAGACLLAISQSGTSPDIVASVEAARHAGAFTIAVTNDTSSDLAAAADAVLPVRAGPEVSVAATKSLTASLVALRLLLGSVAGESVPTLRSFGDRLTRGFARMIDQPPFDVAECAAALATVSDAHIVARGPSLAAGREAGLKLTETCRLTASGWSAAEFRHGPMAAVSPSSAVFCLESAVPGRASVRETAQLATERGAIVRSVRISPGRIAGWPGLDEVPLEVVPFQMLAHAASLVRGLDPDRPAGLSKVTRTT